MNFETNIVPWIDEIQNYLRDSSKRTSEIKKVLKGADLENISYADKAKLYEMFDPKCQISEELFKRQLDLYFALLESKSTNIKIPVFNDYVEWIYSQDPSKMRDITFDILTSRLLKTKATELPEPITKFMDRLPEAFHTNIDRISNTRLGTLVNILIGLEVPYSDLPQESKEFVQSMFNACAVKSEIADKNKNEMRHLFRMDPQRYYNNFNKAFAGVGEYDRWIEEPAKKLRFKHMINYADFQEKVLENSGRSLTYGMFDYYARQMGLPTFPEYDKTSSRYAQFYLKSPREYKDYAKKLGPVFVGMVQDEMSRVEKVYDERLIKQEDILGFANTQRARKSVRGINTYSSKKKFLSEYSDFLIELVHLDELVGQSKYIIYNTKHIVEAKKETASPSVHVPETKQQTSVSSGSQTSVKSEQQSSYVWPGASGYETRRATKRDKVDGQLSLFGELQRLESNSKKETTIEDKIANNQCTVADLPELYELYEKTHGYEVAEMIVRLEEMMKDSKETGLE